MSRVTLPTVRFTVTEFERMADADVFGSRRVELINGRIYRMAPQNNPHMAALSAISDALHDVRLEGDWVVGQGTLRLDRHTAVDPDIMWLAVPRNTPGHLWGHPLLVIEVSHTTYRKDSGIKLRKYAQAGIKDYWILNLAENRMEVYREPLNLTGKLAGCRYGSVTHFAPGQSISPLLRPDVVLQVIDLLP